MTVTNEDLKVTLTKAETKRLSEWLLLLPDNEWDRVTITERSGGGIGAVITAYAHDTKNSEGRFKTISDYGEW
jgi:hypothetical protein